MGATFSSQRLMTFNARRFCIVVSARQLRRLTYLDNEIRGLQYFVRATMYAYKVYHNYSHEVSQH